MKTVSSVHPRQWEVINGEARPKNPFEETACHPCRENSDRMDSCTCHKFEDFDRFATQHTYKSPGVPDGTYMSSELVFLAQYRQNDLEWKDEDLEYLSSFNGIDDYLVQHKESEKRTGIEPRQIIALAEPQVTQRIGAANEQEYCTECKRHLVSLKEIIEGISKAPDPAKGARYGFNVTCKNTGKPTSAWLYCNNKNWDLEF